MKCQLALVMVQHWSKLQSNRVFWILSEGQANEMRWDSVVLNVCVCVLE